MASGCGTLEKGGSGGTRTPPHADQRHQRKITSPSPPHVHPLSDRRRLGRLPPKDVFNDMMFVVEAWTQDDPSCLVEQFCPEYKEQRTSARGNVAVGTLDGLIYTVGGEDSIRCYSSVERYNPDADSWSTDVAPLSSPRSRVCLVAMDQYLCAIGGHDGITAINAVERRCRRRASKSQHPAK